jgi:hypothetical protein
MLTPARLKAVTGLDAAVDLLHELGFTAKPARVDARELKIGDYPENRVLRTPGSKARGYAWFVAEAPFRPPTLKPFGGRLLQFLHDWPLGLLGIPGPDGQWQRIIVIRPNWVRGVFNAVRVSKLEVDISSPTRHDAEVLSSLRWFGQEREAHHRIERGLDVEAVTKRFYLGLAEHHANLIEAVREAADASAAVLNGVKLAGGVDRVALRILTQLLFCWFLQRKRLLANDPDFLRNRFLRRRGNYYQTELERLFYEALSTPADQRPAGAPGPEVPFLNGGLFVRTYGDVSLPLADELFDAEEGLLGFLGSWTFTVAEDVPEEMEVAVDPEMLGKVFENLISDEEEKKQGTVYTPRAVVHFMCREALVPWLQQRLEVDENWARLLLVQDDVLNAYSNEHGTEAVLELAEELDRNLESLTVLDPAVGSGAFPLGMLAEIVRLRRMAFVLIKGKDPGTDDLIAWKLRAIEQTLTGVDINPTAIELCRLRLWLALVVDLPEGETPHPLPNLEHRTIVANSLTDFVNSVEVQNTREGQAGGLEAAALPTTEVIALRHAYFAASDPAQKAAIRDSLQEHEDRLIEEIFDRARRQGDQGKESQQQLEELSGRFRSWDREFPVFAPSFHAPDVWTAGGWDITIMNPPYLGKKEVAQHIDPMRRADYEHHFGEVNDLMVLFAYRAWQLSRIGGVVSMIFNDSIFTSSDASDLRRRMVESSDVLVCARTKCFEGKAVNGGVVVTRLTRSDPAAPLRWVEGYKCPTADFASASDPLPFSGKVGKTEAAGSMSVFSAPGDVFRVLPHRPLFRPSAEAISLLERFTACERWDTIGTPEGWDKLSNTRALDREIEDLRRTGWHDGLQPGRWVLLGYVIEGGQGLATADDKFFLGAIDGTDAAEEHRATQARLEELLKKDSGTWQKYESLRGKGFGREEALIALWADMSNDGILSELWPRGGTFRIAPKDQVRREPLSEQERKDGITSGPTWVPFEKGDQSQPVEGEDGKITYQGARWTRDNPLVIDWSRDAVRILRQRASGKSTRRKPYFRNEHLWFSEGVTWNRVASFLRCRVIPRNAIFADKAPLIRPHVPWLNTDSLMALLNSPSLDFLLRTFVGSRMMIEIGDVRRIPVPVFSPEHDRRLTSLARKAIREKLSADQGRQSILGDIEREIDVYVRELYGIKSDAILWVVR